MKYNITTIRSSNTVTFRFDNIIGSIMIIGIYSNRLNCLPIFSDQQLENTRVDNNNNIIGDILNIYSLYIVNNGRFTLTKVSGEFVAFYIVYRID